MEIGPVELAMQNTAEAGVKFDLGQSALAGCSKMHSARRTLSGVEILATPGALDEGFRDDD
jgi:hypothetical protein